ncbi:motile sperm domain-containing protein 2-like [Stegodyphus dumicola]|uniref:motile sperm domain-containing protein 2-like n=1 Tax=Stegodyphus dumicola TaxID=202533 RepID=UPI0015B1946F|nr:motile sperm domain-containing protein 2-like [Stegodyphus dumicola]
MPLFKEKWYVDDELLEELRSRFLNDINANPEEAKNYHPDDIKRVKENDWYIGRYLLHTEQDVELAYKMLKESLKFRNDMEVNTVKKSDLPIEYFNVRAVILYNKDVRDHPVVVVRCKTHFKKEETRKLQQQYMLYWVEKGIRASNWGVVSILFDCTDSGIGNMVRWIFCYVLNTFIEI